MSEAIQLLTMQGLLLSLLFGTLSGPETVTATALHFFGFRKLHKSILFKVQKRYLSRTFNLRKI